MKRRAIIVDLDGTLCNNDHRHHLYMQEPKDWDAINTAAAFDPVNEWCLEIVKLFNMAGYKILFITGRSESSLDVTKNWLMMHVGPGVDYDLIMRKGGDERDDTVVKTEVYNLQVAPYYDVLFSVDDRKSVVDMWRDLNVPCLDCASNP